jgi:predicted ferric reductase
MEAYGMRKLRWIFWGGLALLTLLWRFAEPALQAATFPTLSNALIQFTGIVAIGCMSLALLLALRPRWPETWLDGLDKMYRLHKWLGIAALVACILHWLALRGPRWLVSWGWVERQPREARAALTNVVEAFLAGWRDAAEDLGEPALYAAIVLIALALVTRFPYRWFYKTHRLLAAIYLLLAFHTVALLKFSYWSTPLGWLMALLLIAGIWAAVSVLLRQVGASRKTTAHITSLRYFPGVHSLEIETEAPLWPGHKSGQFAFATSNAAEGPHPYTIASDWHAETPRIRFVVKELGDHTRRLRARLHIGQEVTLEGPYGRFTFDDDCPHQIWIGGGIGITPFIGRMQFMAAHKENRDWPEGQQVDLFHTTAEVDAEALAKLATDAQSADVRLHLLIDARDGQLSGDRIRALVPKWREASIWFCGPAAFGKALKRDLAAHDFPVNKRFHQELFDMR